MNVISLFNGMNIGRQALENVGIKVNKYYSSEIKPYAIELTQHHFPDTIQVGDVTKWKEWDIDWKSIDLILSGSPCQDLSAAGKRAGIHGKKSSLFFTFVDILNHIKQLNPNVLFLQENVGSASKLDVGIMSRELGVYPVRINSKLVTAQLRDRYYWSNIRTKQDGMFGDLVTDIPQPKDRGIMFKDILTDGYTDRDKVLALLESESRICTSQESIKKRAEKQFINIVYNKTNHKIIPGKVIVRKYEVNILELQKCLKYHKKITIKEISKKLNISKTTVEHWFRTDNSFSIPDRNNWFKLKELLNIKTKDFDKSISEYLEKECNYDQSNRVYNIDYKAPCLTKTGYDIRIQEQNLIYEENNELRCKTNTNKGYDVVTENDCLDLSFPTSTTRRERVTKGKSPCLMESNNNLYSYKDGIVRTVNQVEMERLQGFPDGYTSILSKAKAGSLLGDGWTLPVIEHIFSFIKK